jgi:cysteine desulfurase
VELCSAPDANYVSALRDHFEAEVLSRLHDTEANGASAPRLWNTSNLLFRDVSAEALVIALDMKGIAVSTGSACSSGSVEPSHVLLAMGRSREEARATVRFSFGRYNSAEDVAVLLEAVINSVVKLRATARLEKHAFV